jgi:amino acid adenylation domain-containing protein
MTQAYPRSYPAGPEPSLSNENKPPRLEIPCSLAQQRFWFLEQLDPGNPALNVAVRWRLEGRVSHLHLEEAWRLLLARHQILRASFELGTGGPIQIIAPEFDFAIPIVDLTALPKEKAIAEAERLCQMEARTSFKLSAPPLIRVTLLQLSRQLSILLVTAHHIASDGWSIGILAREMGEIYAALRQESDPGLLRLTIDYGQYAADQYRALTTEALAGEVEFWRRALDGVKRFEIPLDRPRPLVQTSNGSIRSILLDKSLSDGLIRLSRSHGCTLFMTALSTLLVLLHRHSGESDIAIGTQVAGRYAVELEDLVGPFINTVVLRNQLSDEQSFSMLLEQVRTTVLDAFEHQRMPFEKVIELINPERDLSRYALFSVNFIFQRSFIRNARYGDFNLVDLPSFSAGALYDLNFFMVERPEGWRASCEFNTDLFDPQTIESLLARWQTIMQAAIATPSVPLMNLPILSPADSKALLADWRGPYREPDSRTLPQLFAEQARRTPDEIAVVCGGQALSYRELDERSDRLAQALRRRGVVRGSLVGICLERSFALITTLLAVLKTGAAYVPLDPHYPRGRIAEIIDNAQPLLLVTRTSARASIMPRDLMTPIPLLLVDELEKEAESDDDMALDGGPTPEDLAYVIYTSGSTGRPKGVAIPHKALTNLLLAMQAEPSLHASDRWVAVTTISFDIAALEMFLPLIVGARLVIAVEREAVDGHALLHLLASSGATILQATPATWQMLIDAGWSGFPSLRMLCGGERLPRPLAEKLLARGDELWNMYGPTEATIWCSALRVRLEDEAVLLGPPIANTQFYVLDSRGELAALGAPGELYVGGAGLAQGYWRLPALTKERFLPDRFGEGAPGARLYRTGDTVRIRPGRKMEFLGRSDRQVKLHGFRIELGEIEALLLGYPDIAEAVATVGRQPSGDMAIWVHIAPAKEQTERPEMLEKIAHSLLRRSLPAYMQPASIQVLPALPRLPNGKIDARALPAPAPAVTGLSPAEEPANELERKLAHIWSSVLGIEAIPRSASFFEIGGTSLVAARLLSRISAELGRNVSLLTLFKAPSIKELAMTLQDATPRHFDFRPIVKLRANSSGPSIIALNNTGMFYDLALKLADHPFTAIQAFDAGSPLPAASASVEEVAATYVQLIHQVQPKGPYTLLGWCIGGALAFEVAQQLKQRGEEVALLVLIDSWAPGYLRRMPRFNAVLADRSYRLQLAAAHWAATAGRLWARLRSPRPWRGIGDRLLRAAVPCRPRDDGRKMPATAESFDQELQRYLDTAMLGYDPKPYSGSVLLLRCEDQPKPYFLDYHLGWSDYVTHGLATASIAGDHFTMFREPGAQQMSEQILAALSAVAANRGRVCRRPRAALTGRETPARDRCLELELILKTPPGPANELS